MQRGSPKCVPSESRHLMLKPEDELELRANQYSADGEDLICRNCGLDAFDHLFNGCSKFEPANADDFREDSDE